MTTIELPQAGPGLSEPLAYRAYERVREYVVHLRQREAGGGDALWRPGAAARSATACGESMLDASRDRVARLRGVAAALGTTVPAEYTAPPTTDRKGAKAQQRLRKTLGRALRALAGLGEADLIIPEPPILGGFGFEIDGGLHNLDSVRYAEALMALRRTAILDDRHRPGERRAVWEVGAAWGGFAYRLKQLCPNVTYIISDWPETFLFSAVYLETLFPGARIRFCGAPGDDNPFERWDEADFIFVPHSLVDAVTPERLDLVLSLGAFATMTDDQVHAYLRQATSQNSPYVYTFGPDRSRGNEQLDSVRSIVETYYWPHEVTAVSILNKMLEVRDTDDGDTALVPRHLIGWRRLTARDSGEQDPHVG
jgi:hypothetical protein